MNTNNVNEDIFNSKYNTALPCFNKNNRSSIMILFGFLKKTYLSTKALVRFHFVVRNIKIEVILNIISQYTRLLSRQLLRRLYSYVRVRRVHTTPNMRRLEDTKTIHWWKKKKRKTVFYMWSWMTVYVLIQGLFSFT